MALGTALKKKLPTDGKQPLAILCGGPCLDPGRALTLPVREKQTAEQQKNNYRFFLHPRHRDNKTLSADGQILAARPSFKPISQDLTRAENGEGLYAKLTTKVMQSERSSLSAYCYDDFSSKTPPCFGLFAVPGIVQ
jgi:hypothetical protein